MIVLLATSVGLHPHGSVVGSVATVRYRSRLGHRRDGDDVRSGRAGGRANHGESRRPGPDRENDEEGDRDNDDDGGGDFDLDDSFRSRARCRDCRSRPVPVEVKSGDLVADE